MFTFSDTENGSFTNHLPENAGAWYVKVNVTETHNYTSLEKIIPFQIMPIMVEGNKDITISDIHNEEDLKNLMIKHKDTILIKDQDYIVETKLENQKVQVIITFKGNYVGKVETSYTIADEQPNDAIIKETSDITSIETWIFFSLIAAGLLVMLIEKRHEEKNEQ